MRESTAMTPLAEEVVFRVIIGVYYYVNGDKYDGEWKCGKKEGRGLDFSNR